MSQPTAADELVMGASYGGQPWISGGVSPTGDMHASYGGEPYIPNDSILFPWLGAGNAPSMGLSPFTLGVNASHFQLGLS